MTKKLAVAALALAALTLALPGQVDAFGLFNRAKAEVEALPAPDAPLLVVGDGALPAGCCKPVCVKYRDKTHRKVCCDPCLPQIKTTVVVCDPCTGCPVAVDVCLPGCCTDCPKVTERCTLLARGAITYCWDCGFSATFRFQRNGDVLVTYRS